MATDALPLPRRALDKAAFLALNTTDRLRAYLLFAGAPRSLRTLNRVCRLPGTQQATQYLQTDRRAKRVRRTGLGLYAITPTGRHDFRRLSAAVIFVEKD